MVAEQLVAVVAHAPSTAARCCVRLMIAVAPGTSCAIEFQSTGATNIYR